MALATSTPPIRCPETMSSTYIRKKDGKPSPRSCNRVCQFAVYYKSFNAIQYNVEYTCSEHYPQVIDTISKYHDDVIVVECVW